MSDLQCPATLLVVRHGQCALYAGRRLSDEGKALSEIGVTQMRILGEKLSAPGAAPVAAVLTSRQSQAQQSAGIVGRAVGVTPEILPGIEEISVGTLAGRPTTDAAMSEIIACWSEGDLDPGVPGAESGHEVLARFRQALAETADRHRGETVVIVTHGMIMSLFLPLLCDRVPEGATADDYIRPGVPAQIRIDADGWVMDTWAGVPPRREV